MQKAGFTTEIYEKNVLPGGHCTGWKREGYFIDNCIHWLTGTRPGSALHELWKEIGALGDGVELHEKEMFFSSKLNGQTLTFWRDKERTRKEMLELSPEDEEEINKLIKYVSMAETMTYTRYCNSYKGAYMSFVAAKQAKSITVPGVVKGLDNVFLASQWLMGPGGLPTAAAMGKFAAWRIMNRK